MVMTTKPTYHIPGYTGFIAGGEHEFAKTYGEATRHALEESLPKDTRNKGKWEKYTNYSVSTQPRVPKEGYFVTGYSGFVPGVAAENIHAKTYGTSTYAAISKNYVKGQALKGSDRFVTNVQDEFKSYGHPGDVAKFSLLHHERGQLRTNSVRDTEVPVHAERTTKLDPYSLPLEETKTEDKHHIPGYTGFVPGISSENIYSRTYARTTADAYNLKSDPDFCTKTAIGTTDSLTATASFEKKDKLIPGYRGFTPHVRAENIFGSTYGQTSSKVLESRREEATRPHTNPEKVHFEDGRQVKFLFQKKINVKSHYRNKSHISLGDRSHWNKDLFRTTALDRYVEHPKPNHNVFGMYPKPLLKDWKGGEFTQVSEGEMGKQPNYFPL